MNIPWITLIPALACMALVGTPLTATEAEGQSLDANGERTADERRGPPAHAVERRERAQQPAGKDGEDRQRLTPEQRQGRLRERLAERFATLDTDGSGTLTVEELLAAPHPRATADNPPSDAALAAWREQHTTIINAVFASLDRDGDGVLSVEEFTGLRDAARSHQVQARFEAADSDGDGVLSREEWRAQMEERRAQMEERRGQMAERRAGAGSGAGDGKQGRGGQRQGRGFDVDAIFDRIDTNDDGVIDQAEYEAARERMRNWRRNRQGREGNDA